MKESQAGITASMATKAGAGDKSGFSDLIVAGVTMAIPIVLLWIAMISAQSMGAAGASSVVGQGKKIAKWAGKLPYRGAKGMANATGVPGGVKKGWENFTKTGKMFGKKVPLYGGSDARENREAKWAGLMKGGFEGRDEAKIEHERTKANEIRKKWKDQGGANKDEVIKKLGSGSSEEKRAAAMELAENIGFKDLKQYQDAKGAIKDDPVYKNMFNDKAKEKHIRFVIEDKVQKGISRVNEARKSKGGLPLDKETENRARGAFYKTELGKLTADKLAKQEKLLNNEDFHKLYMEDKAKEDPQFVAKVMGKMKTKDRKYWKDKGYTGKKQKLVQEDSQRSPGQFSEEETELINARNGRIS